jgi:hypothetical protein
VLGALGLVFEYSSTGVQSVDRGQVEAMMIEAISARGLRVDVWEPEKPALAIVDDVSA